jgi:hypothetical protein
LQTEFEAKADFAIVFVVCFVCLFFGVGGLNKKASTRMFVLF